jgi:hypothetical protein
VADLYSSTYTSLYQSSSGTTATATLTVAAALTSAAQVVPVGPDPTDIALVVTVVEGRPTCTLAVTNNDTGTHRVTLVRSRGIAGDTRVRWFTDVPVGVGETITVVDDEAVIGTPYTYDMFVDGSFRGSSTSITHAGPWLVDGHPTRCWLRHLTYPSLSQPVLIESWPESTREGMGSPSSPTTPAPVGRAPSPSSPWGCKQRRTWMR